MADRLTRIYTRRGDKGETSLASGRRVKKYDLRIEALGDVDELNCQLGMMIALADSEPFHPLLLRIQNQLFDLGGELAVDSAEYQAINAKHIEQLEQQLDAINAELPPLKEFILPGGSALAAQTHLARAVCRRAERRIMELASVEAINEPISGYLNRLSDLLFVLARYFARQGGGEILWQPGQN